MQDANYRIAVDITRFDALPGEAVVVQALWVITPATHTAGTTGQSAIREVTRGSGYDDLAAAYTRAIKHIGDEIATALSLLRSREASATN